jgi:putative endonuclease
MDKTKNKKTGNYGEDLACEYLIEQKYKILERNLTFPFGEIDILAEAPTKTIVIVEVKTVTGDGWGSAHDLVRHKKQKKLRLLALAIEKEYPGCDIRIDVIGIDGEKIEHLENAVIG